MANEIQADYASSNTLYAVVRNNAGDVWYATGEVFEPWGTNSRDADDYDISLIDKQGSRYVGDIDNNIPAGTYYVQIFLQAGANPADGDSLISSDLFIWTGTGRLRAEKILANKASQDKLTGQITYYDDDGQSVLLVQNPSESQSAVTRNIN